LDESTLASPQKQGFLHSTWLVVVCCFLMTFTSLGFCSSPKQLFLKAVTDALDMDRTLFSFNDTLRFLVTATLSFFFGSLVSRFGTKKMILMGFTLLVASQLLYATATTVALLYLGGILLGAGLSLTSSTLASYIIKRRCTKNVGTLQGLVMSANGLGGALATNLVTPLIEGSPFGYRKAYFMVAAVLTGVGILLMIFFREDKEKPHQATAKKARGQVWEGISYDQAKKRTYFYVCAILVFFTGLVLSGINGIATAHMRDVGIDGNTVKMIWSYHSIALMCIKFLTGFVYDRKGLRFTLIMCQTASITVLVALSLTAPTTFGIGMAWVYSLLSAMALPLETIGVTLVTGDLFGNRDFAKLLGLMTALNNLGYAVGSPVSNLVYDNCGTYVPAIIAGAILMGVVAIAFQFVITAARKDRPKLAA